jgi:serine/threonine-protein phosphatase 6 catalytic subunit
MNIDKWIEELKSGKVLPEKEVKKLCSKIKEILITESNVHTVEAPVTICGDIHGQFYDLLELFRIGGELPYTNYIFIGDFVDRGYNSVETIELLFCYKIKYPSNITLVRGNHESRQVTIVYGFLDEIIRKYGNSNCWLYFMEAFDLLPLGALVGGEIFCVHGGLSPQMRTIDQLRTIDRNVEIPNGGPFCDIMWSDPEQVDTWVLSNRGAGWLFGYKVVKEFNYINGISLIARAHQLVDEGFMYWFPDNVLVTIWSAPNYCYRSGNMGSFLEIDQQLKQNFKTFREVEQSAQSLPIKSVLPYFL